MPTYDYECSDCGDQFEFFQSMTADPLTRCELCGAEGGVRRLIGAGAGLIFKGSGFYITDYKNKKADNDASAKKAESKDKGSSKADGPAKSDAGKSDAGKSDAGKSAPSKGE